MNSLKITLLAGAWALGLTSSPSLHAQGRLPPGPDAEDATLRAAALASVTAFRQGGMDGMAAAGADCYARLPDHPAEAAWRACVGMDMAASYIDLGTARLNAVPTDTRFSHGAVLGRVGAALARAGEAGGPGDAFQYLDRHWETIYQGTDEAASRVYPPAGPGPQLTARPQPVRVGLELTPRG